MTRWTAALAVAAVLLSGCGNDGGGRFDDQADAVRSAVASGDRASALAALDEIAVEGLEAHAAGDLTDGEVQELGELVEQGRALVDDALPEPTTTTEATTTTEPPPPVAFDHEDDDDGGDDGDDGRGKGRKSKDDD